MSELPEEAWNVANWVGELSQLLEANKTEESRSYFRKLVGWYPTSSIIWYSWMQWEWRNSNYDSLEKLFGEALRPYGDVRMWRLYLSYIRLCNVTNDGDEVEATGAKRQTVIKAYELALSHVGVDFYSTPIYRDYITFIQSWPTNSLYEQQVQMDQTRKVYQRALATPLDGIESLWHSYDSYENGLHKLTAKKVLADRSPAYMTARAAARELKDLINLIDRDDYALPPPSDSLLAARKCAQWEKWISWEKANSLGLPPGSTLIQQRVQYAYRCALASSLRRYGEVWFEYSRWLLYNNRRDEAESTLKMAIEVLPRDLLVVFSYCDLLEENKPELAKTAYESLLNSIEGRLTDNPQLLSNPPPDHPLTTNVVTTTGSIPNETLKSGGVGGPSFPIPIPIPLELDSRAGSNTNPSTTMIGGGSIITSSSVNGSSMITGGGGGGGGGGMVGGNPSCNPTQLTLAYIQYMNYCRRVEGIASARAVFTRARKNFQVTFHIFLAAARMEFYCKRDAVVAGKIFELGMARFSNCSEYILAYLYNLLALNDEQNARALFERAILALPSSSALEVWKVYLDHLFRYGDWPAIKLLVKRFQEAYPDHLLSKDVTLFCRQYSYEDATVGAERIWTLINNGFNFTPTTISNSGSSGGGGTFYYSSRLLKPFHVPEPITDLLDRLPSPGVYNGPILPPEAIIRLLKSILTVGTSNNFAINPSISSSVPGSSIISPFPPPPSNRVPLSGGGRSVAPSTIATAAAATTTTTTNTITNTTTTNTTNNTGKNRKRDRDRDRRRLRDRNRLDDGEPSREVIAIPTRPDDIFARRHRERERERERDKGGGDKDRRK